MHDRLGLATLPPRPTAAARLAWAVSAASWAASLRPPPPLTCQARACVPRPPRTPPPLRLPSATRQQPGWSPAPPACDEGPQGHRMLRTEAGGVPATAAWVGGGWRAAPCETRGAGAPHGRSGAQARRVLGLKPPVSPCTRQCPKELGPSTGQRPLATCSLRVPGGARPGSCSEDAPRSSSRTRSRSLEQPGTVCLVRPFISWKHTVKSLWNADGPSSGL